MILDEIVLHNFGVYAGRQSILLAPPSPTRPIVLIGGFNGGGKTTLLDALQLGLYGKHSRCSNRGALGYDEFLRRSVHRGVSPSDGAAVEVQFRHYEEGSEHSYRIHRSWASNGKATRERVEVLKDGVLDLALTENWDQRIEDVIPARISHLFFFDGEQIEALADEQGSSQLLSTAVHSLLGLDLVDQLRADLLVIERRKRTEGVNEKDRRVVERMSGDMDRLDGVRARLVEDRAAAQTELDRTKKRLHEAETKLAERGGTLFEKRKELEGERDAAATQLGDAEGELREYAGGVAPLLLIEDLVRTALERAQADDGEAEQAAINRALKERDARIVKQARSKGLTAKALDVFVRLLEADRKTRTAGKQRSTLGLSREGLGSLRNLAESELPDSRTRGARLVARTEELRARLDKLDRTLAGVPHRDAIASFLATRTKELAKAEQLAVRVTALDAELGRVVGERARAQAKIERSLAELGDTELAAEDATRIIHHSKRVRDTVERFRAAVVARNVSRIEKLVFEGLQHLFRKNSLVRDLRIDPETLTLKLFGADQARLPLERLSAGERQLLAVSLLWGLARAAGRPLPAIIDTPLGRLDSTHRAHLVERYFPHASHQVLLLSTDEEIDKEHYAKLQSRVGRSYLLRFDESRQATTVEPGYFWD